MAVVVILFVRLFVVESATIRQYIGKVFQFYSNDSRKKRIMKKVAGAIPAHLYLTCRNVIYHYRLCVVIIADAFENGPYPQLT
jgi:hypothetical protein